jgi:hypothetical protein
LFAVSAPYSPLQISLEMLLEKRAFPFPINLIWQRSSDHLAACEVVAHCPHTSQSQIDMELTQTILAAFPIPRRPQKRVCDGQSDVLASQQLPYSVAAAARLGHAPRPTHRAGVD